MGRRDWKELATCVCKPIFVTSSKEWKHKVYDGFFFPGDGADIKSVRGPWWQLVRAENKRWHLRHFQAQVADESITASDTLDVQLQQGMYKRSGGEVVVKSVSSMMLHIG